MFFPPRKGQPGDELNWAWLNKIRAWCRRNEIYLGMNSGLSMLKLDCGTFLRVSDSTGNGQLAVVDSSGITARVSTVAGSGNVYPVAINGTNLTTDMSMEIPVVNFSSTSGGIPMATYVWISQDPGGTWVITAIDCGN
jgi:hypothetical protein